MVLEFLHEADLCLLLYGLMSGSILTHTECIVRPDEFHGELHEGCHTYCWLHIVGEDEECGARCDDASVECHAYAAACHGELCHTCLKECAGEVAFGECLSLLEEGDSLVRFGKVGRRADHVGHLLCELCENCA